MDKTDIRNSLLILQNKPNSFILNKMVCFNDKFFIILLIKICRNPGLNQGPLDLQSNALATELLRRLVYSWINNIFVRKIDRYFEMENYLEITPFHICKHNIF